MVRIQDLFDMNRVKPRRVFDKFLNRYQVRVITDWEYVCLMSDVIKWYKDQTGMKADIIALGAIACPMYGDEAWS